MDRFSGTGFVTVGGHRQFIDLNIATGAGSYPNALWFNGIQESVIVVVEAAGLTPSDADNTQLLQAIKALLTARSTAVYAIIGGVQQVSVNGAAFTATGASAFAWPVSGVAKVTVIGGGSGGGGCNGSNFAGPSGGGGGWAVRTIAGQTPGSTTSITAGAGGAGSAAAGASGGGGTSSFGSFLSATGGAPAGTTPVYAGGGPGAGVGGDVNQPGAWGSDGSTANPGSDWPGLSGASLFGGGVRASLGPGILSAAYGAGGGAAYGGTANNGSAGASGCVIVEY